MRIAASPPSSRAWRVTRADSGRPRFADVLGTMISAASLEVITSFLLAAARSRNLVPRVVTFAGASTLLAAFHNPAKRASLARADLVIGEGAALSAYSGLASCAKHPSFDAVETLTRLFASADPRRPVRVFLYGGLAGRGERAAAWINRCFPGVRVVGTADLRRRTSLVEQVNEACADVLVVGLGETLTSAWIDENVALLDVGLVIGAGDAIDGLGGDPRARRATPSCGPIAGLSFLLASIMYLAFGVRPRALSW